MAEHVGSLHSTPQPFDKNAVRVQHDFRTSRVPAPAQEVAYKKNYPQQFFVSETRIDKNQVRSSVYRNPGSTSNVSVVKRWTCRVDGS